MSNPNLSNFGKQNDKIQFLGPSVIIFHENPAKIIQTKFYNFSWPRFGPRARKTCRFWIRTSGPVQSGPRPGRFCDRKIIQVIGSLREEVFSLWPGAYQKSGPTDWAGPIWTDGPATSTYDSMTLRIHSNESKNPIFFKLKKVNKRKWVNQSPVVG